MLFQEAGLQPGGWKQGCGNRPRAKEDSQFHPSAPAQRGRASPALCDGQCVGPSGPVFIIRPTFLGFLREQALIIREWKRQRKILI